MLSVPFPKPRPLPRPKPDRLQRRRKVTIAIHLSGGASLVTATDTQETYSSGEKVDSGKIISYGRMNPLGSISIAGAGDSEYIKAISQELGRKFQAFKGNFEELEGEIRKSAADFYREHVFPFEGKRELKDIPDYSLLIAAYHDGKDRLWDVENDLLTDSALFECIGAGKPAADSLLNRLYPRYPTLDSLAILAAYVIYRVKKTVDGCGLNTEIRYLIPDSFVVGWVAPGSIEKWEALFRKYDRLERDALYHALNFPVRPSGPPEAVRKSMQEQGIPIDHEREFPAQMKPLPDIVNEIGEIRAEFAALPSIDPRNKR
jgi:hypothetical protein